MNVRRSAAILLASAAALLLAGCTFHAEAGPSTSATKIATLAENALEKSVGSRPDIDCGTKDVILVNGKSITCDLTDPTSGNVYDVKITFSNVKGNKFQIDTKVADTPKSTGAPKPTDDGDAPEPSSADDSAPSGAPDSVTVPGATIASLAANALAGQLGFTPDIECFEDQVPIYQGYVENCSFTAKDVKHDVQVTITEFDGKNYKINAKVVS